MIIRTTTKLESLVNTMQDTLFFDSKCPLCSHEIKILNRLKGNNLRLIDIHSSQNSQQSWSNAELLSILHLQTAQGDWLKGLDATVHAWQHTSLGFLFKPLRWPLIRHLFDWAYMKWAQQRSCNI